MRFGNAFSFNEFYFAKIMSRKYFSNGQEFIHIPQVRETMRPCYTYQQCEQLEISGVMDQYIIRWFHLVEPNLPPNSCQDVKKIGRHLIDPDGPGGNPPFVVNCVHQDQSFVTTVEHLNGGNIFLSSPGKFTRTVHFVYNASVSQLEGLTKAAASCRQFTKV